MNAVLKPVQTLVLGFALLLAWAGWIWWLAASSGTLPAESAVLLLALPGVWWLGRPWPALVFSHGSVPWFLGSGAAALFGAAFGSLTLATLAWVLALGGLLRLHFPDGPFASRVRLLALSACAFPWLILEGDALGRAFRHTGAAVAAVVGKALGFQVERSGTELVVEGAGLSVEAACAGLHTLQVLLAIGLAVLFLERGSQTRLSKPLLLILGLAWAANTLRVLAVAFLALTFGPEVASGALHDASGVAAALVMFALAQKVFSRQSVAETASSTNWFSPAVALLGLLQAWPMAASFHNSPFDRLWWAAFAIWSVPVWLSLRVGRFSPGVSSAAMAVMLLAAALDLNLLRGLGLALGLLALAWGRLPPLPRLVWLAGAVSWWSILGLAAAKTGAPPWLVGFLRVAVALACVWPVLRPSAAPSTTPAASPARVLNPGIAWCGLGLSLVLAACWQTNELPDASSRLAALPRSGPGFVSRELPLTDAEKAVFGNARAVRHRYTFGGGQAVVTMIDGTANRHALHDPAHCLSGAGWRVVSREDHAVPQGKGQLMVLEKDGSRVSLLAWYSDGGACFGSPWEAWLRSSARHLTFGRSGGAVTLTLVQFQANSVPAPELLGHLVTTHP